MNRKHMHQGPEEPLTEKGQKQALEVAIALKKKEVDALMCSPFVRARNTAEIIGGELDIPLIVDESVREFRRPDSLYGKPHYSLHSLAYMWKLYRHREDDTWDDGGAENMFAVRNRIVDAKKAIAKVTGKKVVVVSHAIFIDMFVQSVCADRTLSFNEFVSAVLGAKKLPNTGVITFEIDDTAPPETCNWWMVASETNEQYLKYK